MTVYEQKERIKVNDVLRLEGSVENMELYLNYLKCEGFKIK